jgi:ribonuclease HI
MTHPAVGREKHLLDPTVRADRNALEELLHEDFTEVGVSGTAWDRNSIIQEMTAHPEVSGMVSGMSADELAYGVALVTYELAGVRRASIWVRDTGRWQVRYHQATAANAMSENR